MQLSTFWKLKLLLKPLISQKKQFRITTNDRMYNLYLKIILVTRVH